MLSYVLNRAVLTLTPSLFNGKLCVHLTAAQDIKTNARRSREESVKESSINCKIMMALKPFIKICYDAAVHDLSLSACINIHHGSRVRAGYVLFTRRE